jgi:hypothetical protein
MRPRALDGAQRWNFLTQALKNLPSRVGRTIVNHDDFMGYTAESKLKIKVLDGRGDAAFFIPCGDDDGKELELSGHEFEEFKSRRTKNESFYFF